jgi:hypothetical protein
LIFNELIWSDRHFQALSYNQGEQGHCKVLKRWGLKRFAGMVIGRTADGFFGPKGGLGWTWGDENSPVT